MTQSPRRTKSYDSLGERRFLPWSYSRNVHDTFHPRSLENHYDDTEDYPNMKRLLLPKAETQTEEE